MRPRCHENLSRAGKPRQPPLVDLKELDAADLTVLRDVLRHAINTCNPLDRELERKRAVLYVEIDTALGALEQREEASAQH